MESLNFNRVPTPENSVEGESFDLEREINQVDSFDALFAVLDKAGGIEESGHFYSSEHLQQIINEVRIGNLDLGNIPTSHGLRQKVMELVEAEQKANSRVETTERPMKMPRAGEKITVKTINLRTGEELPMMSGVLLEDIHLLEPITLDVGGEKKVSHPVKAMKVDGGEILIYTENHSFKLSSEV